MELRADILRKVINRYKIEVVFLSVSTLMIVASIVIAIRAQSGTTPIETVLCTESPEDAESDIQVDLSGAVANPDVYTLPKGTILKELIQLGGGLQDTADVEYVTYQYNFASQLKDEQKIYIPFKNNSNLDSNAHLSSQESQIHINSADKSELESLPGIGQVTAERIINNRPYKSTQELLEKKVINKGTYDKISDLIDL